jgi:hypothetical protein
MTRGLAFWVLVMLFAAPVHAEQRILAGHPVPKPKVTTSTTVKFGINAHDGRYEYPLSGAEQRMQWMKDNHLVSYRVDVGPKDTAILDQLVSLGKKYGVTIRPMLYPNTQAETYALVKRYAADIKVWEIGNEQDAPRQGAQDRINKMMLSVRGVEQAEAELHAGLKTTINIMSCNPNAGSGSQCEGDQNGDIWFLDMAYASGWKFNYVSFHYYPRAHEPGYWMDTYFAQMRNAAQKYKVPILFNETNCGEIYDGDTDGASTCQTSLDQNLSEVVANYADIVEEVNVYEMIDQKSIAGVEGHFGVLASMGNPKPTAALLASYAAATVVPPPTPRPPLPSPPAYSGTVDGTFTGTVTLTPAK